MALALAPAPPAARAASRRTQTLRSLRATPCRAAATHQLRCGDARLLGVSNGARTTAVWLDNTCVRLASPQRHASPQRVPGAREPAVPGQLTPDPRVSLCATQRSRRGPGRAPPAGLGDVAKQGGDSALDALDHLSHRTLPSSCLALARRTSVDAL